MVLWSGLSQESGAAIVNLKSIGLENGKQRKPRGLTHKYIITGGPKLIGLITQSNIYNTTRLIWATHPISYHHSISASPLI